MGKRMIIVATALLAMAASPVLAITVIESFDPGYGSGPNTWTQGGRRSMDLGDLKAEFPAGDPRLIDSSRQSAGGIFISATAGPSWGGDNEQYWIDLVIQGAPNTTYTSFSAAVDTQISWSNPTQPWGKSMIFYLGNSAQMAWGSQPSSNSPPTGPWQGHSWNPTPPEPTRISGTLWNGSPERNGIWESWNWTQRLGDGATSITTGADGLVIFRMGIQNKSKNDGHVAFALDNLSITLVPEPASLLLLGLGLPLLRRRVR